MSEDETSNIDDPSGDAYLRFAQYKQQERKQGRSPMDWGDWLRAGQPL